MAYQIRYTNEALRALSDLSKKHRNQFVQKIETLEDYPRATGCKKLKGNFEIDMFRLRSGIYRVIFTVRNDELVIMILDIGHRRKVYNKL